MKLKDKFKDNEKIKKLKQYKESFDILWSNPRSHASIMLAFWFVLILILALVIRLNGKVVKSDLVEEIQFEATSDGLKNYLKNIDSYQAVVTINSDIEYLLDITCLDNQYLINYNGNNYYYDDSLYLISGDEKVSIYDNLIDDVYLFNISNIYDLIKEVSEDYITLYNNGLYLINYSILANEFFLDFGDSSDVISVKFTGDNGINMIEFDFSNLQMRQFYDKVTIEYNNINNIFSINVLED